MARVSQDHLDARRRQILDAARRCFVRNGFHATSMQDVLGEAKLSTGAVYRYFRSKNDIIAAIATDALAEMAAAFTNACDTSAPPPPDEVIGRVLGALERLVASEALDNIAIQAWGEALRSPALARNVTDGAGQVRATMTELVAAYQRHGRMTRSVPAEHIASVLVSLIPGFLVQHALLGDVDATMFRRALHALLASDDAPPTAAPTDQP